MIIGGMLLGLSRKAATEFSFFLAIPTLIGAGVYDTFKYRSILSAADIPLFAVGLATAFFSALVCVHWLIRFVATHSFVAVRLVSDHLRRRRAADGHDRGRQLGRVTAGPGSTRRSGSTRWSWIDPAVRIDHLVRARRGRRDRRVPVRRSHLREELHRRQPRVGAAERQQLAVRARLHHGAGIHHDDPIGRLHRGEPMRDDERSPVRSGGIERLLHHALRLRVQRARRLVEQQDRPVREDRPRDREPLSLAAGQPHAALAKEVW